ncbi:MAG: 50S ribosomal protein L30 [Bdellovibrionales bacterium]|nr:50S ribosomal protein L30 [Bdellovibrionales bacterium]
MSEQLDNEKDVKRVRVRQIRGVRGRTTRTRATLNALGLGRVGKEKEFDVNPALVGMIRAVRHLVDVEKLA